MPLFIFNAKKGDIGNDFSLEGKVVVIIGGSKGLGKGITMQQRAESGINVNAIAPGYYLTEMTKPLLEDENVLNSMIQKIPQKRLGEPKDLVGAAMLLASNASEYITGQVIYVDGGWLIE